MIKLFLLYALKNNIMLWQKRRIDIDMEKVVQATFSEVNVVNFLRYEGFFALRRIFCVSQDFLLYADFFELRRFFCET